MADKDEEAYLDELLRSMSMPSEPNSLDNSDVVSPEDQELKNDEMNMEEPVALEQQALRDAISQDEGPVIEPVMSSDPNAMMSNDDIEALLRSMNPDVEEAGAPLEDIQEPIEDITEEFMEEPTAEEPVVEETVVEETVVEESVVEAIAEEPVDEPVMSSDPNAMMSNDDIEALLRSMNPDVEETSAPLEDIQEPIEDITEEFMEEATAEEPVVEESVVEAIAEEPVVEPVVSSDPNAMMSNDDIEALLRSMNPDVEETSAPHEEVPEQVEDNLEELTEEPVLEEVSLEGVSFDEPLDDSPVDELVLEEGGLEDSLSLDDLMSAVEPSASSDDTTEQLELENSDEASSMDVDLSEMEANGGDLPEEDEESTGDGPSIDDMIKAVQGEMGGDEADIFGDVLGLTTDDNATDVADPLASAEAYGETADILALDDGMGLSDNVDLNADSLSDEEKARVASMSEEDSGDNQTLGEPEQLELETDGEQKKKKKKFSLKDFFLKFSDDEEEKPVDMNQEMMKELYGDNDSLADANPEEEFGKGKKKKEKKKKEPKPKKEKKKKEPKPKKEKPPKDPALEVKIPIVQIIVGVVISLALIAIVVFGGEFLHYGLTMSHAQTYYDQKNYQAAYDTLAGMKLRDQDQDLYTKVELIVNVKQGLDTYNFYYERNEMPDALDSLVRAVGRKNQIEEQIVAAGVVLEVDNYYLKILSTLDYYGISEETALDLYSARNYEYYYSQLQTYAEGK